MLRALFGVWCVTLVHANVSAHTRWLSGFD